MITAAGRGEHEIMADHIADKIEKTADQAENQTENKMKRMRDLVDLLNRARRAYEQEDTEIMSNYEYDQLYDELQALEKELNTTLAASPTVNVGYEVLSELQKEQHERPMLSLDKTKDVELLPLKGGSALFAIKARVPVYPVMCLRKTRPFIRTKIIVGDPIDLSDFYDMRMTAEDYAAAEERIRERMLATKHDYIATQEAKKRAKKQKKGNS